MVVSQPWVEPPRKKARKSSMVDIVHSCVSTCRATWLDKYDPTDLSLPQGNVRRVEDFAIPPRPVTGTDHASVGACVLDALEKYVFGLPVRRGGVIW